MENINSQKYFVGISTTKTLAKPIQIETELSLELREF